MRLIKMFALLFIVMLLFSFTGLALAAPLADNPGKGTPEIGKVVFVHYPQGSVAFWSPVNAPAPTDENTRYKYTGIHWAVPYVEYTVNPSGAPAGAGDAVEAAFDTWEAEPSHIDFTRLSDDYSLSGGVFDGNNVVSWEDITEEYPDAIAVAVFWYYQGIKEIIEVDTIMNSVDPWSVNAGFTGDPDIDLGDTAAYDVQHIMTHEAGHWLILEDLYQWQTQKLTMYGYGAKGELHNRTLGIGDKLGINRIY